MTFRLPLGGIVSLAIDVRTARWAGSVESPNICSDWDLRLCGGRRTSKRCSVR